MSDILKAKSLESIERLKKVNELNQQSQKMNHALKLLEALAFHAKSGFTEIVLKNPITGEHRSL